MRKQGIFHLFAILICLAFATLAAQQWSERGPVIGGRLSAIVAADGGHTLLVASPGGGVWRSADGGKQWTYPANAGATDLSFVHLEWDAVNPRRLFGLTWNALYASTDRADSWTPLINADGAPVPLNPQQASVTDPKPFGQLRLAPSGRAVFAALPCSGLFYSFDGVRFTQHWPFPGGSSNLSNCVGNIVADPVSRRVYFSTLNQSRTGRLFRSDCAGTAWQANQPCLTWQPAETGLPGNYIVASMVSVSEPGHGDHLVLQMEGDNASLDTFVTTDGLSWSRQSKQQNSWTPRALVHPPGGSALFEGYMLLGYSPDLGVTWRNLDMRMAHPDYRSIYVDAGAGTVWAVNDGSMAGAYANLVRYDWRPGGPPTNGVGLGHAGLSVWQAYYATVVPHGSGRRVFVGAQDNASLCADDVVGHSWTDDGGAPVGGDSFIFQLAPSNPNRAYAWANDQTRFARADNVMSAASCAAVRWTVVRPQNDPPTTQLIGPWHWSRHNLAVHPRNPDRVYFALSFGVGVSTNAGATVVHRDVRVAGGQDVVPTPARRPARPERFRPVAIDVDADGAIYIGTEGRGLFKSADDGVSWTPWGLNQEPPAVVAAIVDSGGRTPTFWAATTDGLYRLARGSSDWMRVTGAGRTVSDVAVDRSCPGRVYAAYGFAATQGQQRGGVAVTSNNGATWASITSGEIIDRVPVTSIQVDPQQPKTLYAATYGRGFWVFDWGSTLPPCGR